MPPPRALGEGIETLSPESLDEAPRALDEHTGDLTLRDALARALRSSPDLEAFAWEVRANEARTLQAGLLPNPVLSAEGENFGGSGDFSSYDAAESTLFLGQLVELGGKRAKRRRVAALEGELSGWDYEAARLDVLTETTKRFLAALAAQMRLELSEDLVRLAGESLQATQARVRAGAASAVEESRSAVELATLEVKRTRSQQDLQAARRLLASSWGETTARFETVVGNLSSPRTLPDLERVSAELSENPDVARWAVESAKREAALELADANAIPDVTAGLGVRRLHDSNDTALLFAVEVPLPLFDRNQGERAAALAERHRARALARAKRQELSRELVATHAEAQSAHAEAVALHEAVLPKAEEAFRRTRDGYRKGLFRYVDVLDAQRTLFEARAQHIDALENYHAATTELERLVGSPTESLTGRNN